jgi:hypothetical protein
MEKEKRAYFRFINSLGDELDEAGEDFQNELGYESAYPFFYGYHSRDEEINALKAEIENLEEANHDWQVQSDKYEGAYLKAKAEIERKDEALNNIKIGAERIQNLDYGWEGDCGAINHAEFIETLAEQALQDEEK